MLVLQKLLYIYIYVIFSLDFLCLHPMLSIHNNNNTASQSIYGFMNYAILSSYKSPSFHAHVGTRAFCSRVSLHYWSKAMFSCVTSLIGQKLPYATTGASPKSSRPITTCHLLHRSNDALWLHRHPTQSALVDGVR